MRMNLSLRRALVATFLLPLLSAVTLASAPRVTERLDRSDMTLGESARLTISASGADTDSISPPTVPGLEFTAVGESSQIQSINGETTSERSVTYQVTPQRSGTFTLPAAAPGSPPLVLQVAASGAGPGSAAGTAPPGKSLPAVRVSGLTASATRLTADGSAFVRLRAPKRQLYVGESIPVDIQVGLRQGLTASLTGLPRLNGDAFTLNPLPSEPQQDDELVGGAPFTVLTWRTVLSVVKPGNLSLTIDTPLTVRMRTPSAANSPEDSPFGNLFDDPFFQNFFGATTEKEVMVRSPPVSFDVAALPDNGRPGDFRGAVGHFAASSDLSATSTSAGDPLTLRMTITGSGNFDRVSSTMLSDAEPWKTYQPTTRFEPEDQSGYRGQKIFEQALIATQAGTLAVPALSFSYFDPDARRYETLHTLPQSVAVAPAPASANPSAVAGKPPAPEPAESGLLPDKAASTASANSLTPHFFQLRYLAAPVGLAVVFSGAWLWLWLRGLHPGVPATLSPRDDEPSREQLRAQMDWAAGATDAPLFFRAARRLLPARSDDPNVDAILNLANEATYGGRRFAASELRLAQQQVLQQTEGHASP